MASFWWLAPLHVRASTALRVVAQRKFVLRVEDLEARDVPAALVTPHYILDPNSAGGASPFGNPGPTGMSPAAIRHAYGFDQVSYTGAGTTIAIVDAYDDPSIASDLHNFDVAFGLADPNFTKVNQTGGSTPPASDTGWAGEIALDVEWAHAIAPGANILLVEANSASYNDLLAAVDYAAKQTGVVAVSMSWGGGEFSSETSLDSHFVTPSGHSGVVFIASSGDAGAPTSYPAVSPNVLSVGGTSLYLSSGNYSSESGWSGSGGGISAYENKPSYQSSVTQSSTKRTNPDVAYDADPNTGFAVYQTFGNSTVSSGPWLQYGGTSDAAPQWAGLIALADQGRAANGLSALSSATLLPMIYQLPSSDFHDVTSGTSTGSPNYTAGSGYDLVTGRGSPIANKLIADLIGSTSGSTHFSVSTPTTTTAGSSFSVTVTAQDASNKTATGFTGTVHFTSSDGQASLPTDYTFTASDQGTHTFTVTLKTAGTDSITATAGSTTGSQSLAVTPASPTHLAFTQQPANTVVGAVISPAVTVSELDAYGNVATQDSTTQITLTIGTNAGGGTLTGGGPVTVSKGVATFSGLSLNKVGNGYTLVASGGSLTGATSSAFNVTTSSGTVIEAFDSGLGNYYYTGSSYPMATTSTAAAHDGTRGLLDVGDGDWYLRVDSAATINPGDTVSVWTRFVSSADGRAYFGFGTTTSGTLSAVLAPNTRQLIIQNNAGFGFTNLASVSQTYQANHWYRVEVAWGTSGKVTVRLYDSDGTTLLNSVTVATGDVTAGGFAFRATGSTKDWDTVSVTRGVNSFTLPTAPATPVAPVTSGSSSTPGASSPGTTSTIGELLSVLFGSSAPGSAPSNPQTLTPAQTQALTTLLLYLDPATAEELFGGLTHRIRL